MPPIQSPLHLFHREDLGPQAVRPSPSAGWGSVLCAACRPTPSPGRHTHRSFSSPQPVLVGDRGQARHACLAANARGRAPQRVKVEESGPSSGNSAEARVRKGSTATERRRPGTAPASAQGRLLNESTCTAGTRANFLRRVAHIPASRKSDTPPEIAPIRV